MRRKKKRGKNEKGKNNTRRVSPVKFSRPIYNINRQSLREGKKKERKVIIYREEIGGIPLVQFLG